MIPLPGHSTYLLIHASHNIPPIPMKYIQVDTAHRDDSYNIRIEIIRRVNPICADLVTFNDLTTSVDILCHCGI